MLASFEQAFKARSLGRSHLNNGKKALCIIPWVYIEGYSIVHRLLSQSLSLDELKIAERQSENKIEKC